MQYFVSFRENNTVECSWQNQDGKEHPSYIKADIHEISADQYSHIRNLELVNGEVIDNHVSPSLDELRAKEYSLKSDPLALEAIRSFLMYGNLDIKWLEYINQVNLVKSKYPKE